MPNFKFEHPDLRAMKPLYILIDDCVAGEAQVKAKGANYLPKPNATDLSQENVARYKAYLTRAVFYNVTRRTLNGLIGAIFETEPTEQLPDALKPVVLDASGGGISLEQLAHRAAQWCLSNGRLGVLVDFPKTPDGGVSKALADKLHPTITTYTAVDIINWRVEEVDGRDQLTLVVLKEQYIVSDDGFQQIKKTQYRELRLGKEGYYQQIWRDNVDRPFARIDPKDANGQPFKEILFTFIGAENNDPDVDDPPMYDLASLNIAHYRNSADYEEAAYIVGQPTPWFSGLTESWVREVLNGRVELGSRAAIALPENGAAGILQAVETTMAFAAMEHKERQMVALGAKLVQQAEVERTATEAGIEHKGETSILANVSRNVTAGIEWALARCMLFITGTLPGEDEIQYKLNTEFGLADLPPEELTAVMTAWQGGAISFTEMRNRLRAGKLATEKDDDAKTEIEADQVKADQRETDKLTKQAEGSAQAQAKFPKPPPPRA